MTREVHWLFMGCALVSVAFGATTAAPLLTGLFAIAFQLLTLGVLERWIRHQVRRRARGHVVSVRR